ncbi:hypothetical protein FA95DRAFT_1601945 [Auriscalpium vulgare]|uniref:Uncharacterized protein n=1 Tax=Auriscalpium vulgare TaxID=40419 RepID=A0ACB8S6Z1_9AGAM|nr:hypothetical protein FA95DRAFT_1601945 [Auriscalpium vulgare]
MSNSSFCVPSGIDPNNNPDGIFGIDANPDVSGVGMRLNFYVTLLALAVIPQTPYTERLLATLYSNAGLAGLGLLLTAIIQTAQKQLSFYHAIIVLHMLFFLGVGVAPSGSYRWATVRLIFMAIFQIATLVSLLGWGLYLWVHADTYGSQPACNDQVKYVLFFVSVRGTAPWLGIFWDVLLVISTVSPFLGAIIGTGVSMWLRRALRRQEGDDEGEPESFIETTPKPSRRFYVSFPLFTLAVYAIVHLELIVHRNKHLIADSSESEWTFGQVLALVMTFITVNEIAHFLFLLLRRQSGEVNEELEADKDLQINSDVESAMSGNVHHPGRVHQLPTMGAAGGRTGKGGSTAKIDDANISMTSFQSGARHTPHTVHVEEVSVLR